MARYNWEKEVDDIFDDPMGYLDSYSGHNYVVGNEGQKYYWSVEGGISIENQSAQNGGGQAQASTITLNDYLNDGIPKVLGMFQFGIDLSEKAISKAGSEVGATLYFGGRLAYSFFGD